MKTLALSNEEAARSGFSHKAIVSHAQGDFTATATSQSYTLWSAAAGQIIDRVARRNVTNLSVTGASAAACIVGDDDDDDGYLVTKSMLTGATPIDTQALDGAYGNQAGGKAYTAAKSLIAKVSSDVNIALVTAGEVHIYFRVVDLSKV